MYEVAHQPSYASYYPIIAEESTTLSDAAIAALLHRQEQQQLAERQQALGQTAGPSGRDYYQWLAGAGVTTTYSPQSWCSYQERASTSATGTRQRLQQRLERYRLQEHCVRGDGNCQFRAIADQLLGSQRQHAAVREAVVWQLTRHPELYLPHVAGVHYGDYCRGLLLLGEWGDHCTLQAAADAYDARIVVLTGFAGEAAPFVEVTPRLSDGVCAGAAGRGRYLYISHAGSHYNSVYPAGHRHPSTRKLLGSKKLHRLVRVLF